MPNTLCGYNSVAGGASGSDLLVAYGPTIFVDVGFDPGYKSGKPPIPGMTGIRALIDTGATESCIDSALARNLNLPIIDRRIVAGISGKEDVNIHLAQVRFPALNFTIYGAFAGVHLEAGGQPHKALIGRTFLQVCTMVYDGRTGTVSISTD